MDDNQGYATRLLMQYLESLERAGVQQLPRVLDSAAPQAAAPAVARSSPATAAAAATRSEAPRSAPPPPAAAEAVTPVEVRSNRETSGLNQVEPSGGRSPRSTVDAAAPVEPAVPESPQPQLQQDTDVALSLKKKQHQLEIVNAEVRGCTLCPQLVATRTQTVFGVGSPNARLCFFGEAPGADEDRVGEPFVGAAGQLLNRIITNACGMRREDVYIMNTVRCRPPGNRNPLPEEVDNCRRFFERQFEIVRPEFICCLGLVAAQALLETKLPVGKLRGRIHEWRWAKVVVTYHPAYLLRSPGQKAATWEDIKMLLREMGVPPPTTSASPAARPDI